jgi:hypothetical protein
MELLANFNATTLTGVGMAVPATSGGGSETVSAVLDADGTWVSLNTATTSDNDAIYANYARYRRDWDPELYARIKTAASIANIRHYVGMYSANPSGAATNNTIHQAGFRFDTGVPDTNWQFCTGDGTTQACTDTGVAVSASTAYTLAVVCTVTGTNQCLGYINGSLVATRTANLPDATTTIGYHVGTSTLTGASRSLLFGRLTILHK